MTGSHSDKKTIFSTALGACLEWYDFSIYMFTTPMIAAAFFPKENQLIALMAAFAIFAAGYLMRPIGGFFFSNMGDKLGRKKVLILTTGLMCIPMLVTAVLPTYHQWGLFAVVLLLLMRMLQGFSVGGEYTGVLVMLLEQAPKKHRALITSIASIVSGLGIVLSSLTVTTLTHILGNHAMMTWGWRIPFFIGFLLALWAYQRQKNLQESPSFIKAVKKKRVVKVPFIEALKHHPKQIFFVFVLAGFLGIACYLGMAFFPSYLTNIRHLAKKQVMDITSLCTILYLFFIPLSASISDRYGRKPVLIVTTILFILTSYPAFMLVAHGTLFDAFWGIFIILAIYGAAVAVFVTFISELFPTQERYSGVSTGYNIGNAIFGGTTPLVATYLINTTHSQTAPAWYLAISAVITLLIIFTMPETVKK